MLEFRTEKGRIMSIQHLEAHGDSPSRFGLLVGISICIAGAAIVTDILMQMMGI